MSPRQSCVLYKHSVCIELTHKQLEVHRCVLSRVSTDALALKRQAISIHSADQLCNAFDQFHWKIITFIMTILKSKINFEKKIPCCLRVKWFHVQIPWLPECHSGLGTIHNGIHYANSSTHGFSLGLSGSWPDAAYVICLYILLICTVHPINYALVHVFLGFYCCCFCNPLLWSGIISSFPCACFNICGHFAEHIINDPIIGGDIGFPYLSDPIGFAYATDWYINLFLCLYK